jgi:hypothetical protein
MPENGANAMRFSAATLATVFMHSPRSQVANAAPFSKETHVDRANFHRPRTLQ